MVFCMLLSGEFSTGQLALSSPGVLALETPVAGLAVDGAFNCTGAAPTEQCCFSKHLKFQDGIIMHVQQKAVSA
jgi:hypothetical protein